MQVFYEDRQAAHQVLLDVMHAGTQKLAAIACDGSEGRSVFAEWSVSCR